MIYHGSSQIEDLYYGSVLIGEVWYGSTLVYRRTPGPTPSKVRAIIRAGIGISSSVQVSLTSVGESITIIGRFSLVGEVLSHVGDVGNIVIDAKFKSLIEQVKSVAADSDNVVIDASFGTVAISARVRMLAADWGYIVVLPNFLPLQVDMNARSADTTRLIQSGSLRAITGTITNRVADAERATLGVGYSAIRGTISTNSIDGKKITVKAKLSAITSVVTARISDWLYPYYDGDALIIRQAYDTIQTDDVLEID